MENKWDAMWIPIIFVFAALIGWCIWNIWRI